MSIIKRVAKHEKSDGPLYFNHDSLGEPTPNYVAWIDMMGARAAMAHSLAVSSNHIGRVHSAVLRSRTGEVLVYPAMDGAYVTSVAREPIESTLRGFFECCAEYFAATERDEHRFLVRGGLAYGPVIHGRDISSNCSRELAKDEPYKSSLLFGIPVVQANRCEALAPPFGVYVDESARSFAPSDSRTFSGLWWRWWTGDSPPDAFTARIRKHFDWCENNWRRIEYSQDRIKEHRDLARQYMCL